MKLYENSNNSYFPERPLRASLPFGPYVSRLTFIFYKNIKRSESVRGKNYQELRYQKMRNYILISIFNHIYCNLKLDFFTCKVMSCISKQAFAY